MFSYEKRLEYPIHIKETNPKLAKAIISQYGGPNGELGASMRYLSQRRNVWQHLRISAPKSWGTSK